MVLPGQVQLVQGDVEHSGSLIFVAQAGLPLQAIAVVANWPDCLDLNLLVDSLRGSERRNRPSVHHVRFWLDDGSDWQMVVAVVVDGPQLHVGLAVLGAFNPLVTCLQESERGAGR